MLIHLTIKSKNNKSIFHLLNTINKFLKNKKLMIESKILKTKRFSVLKSPHVNKTAQEQFSINTFSIYIKIGSSDILKFLIFLKTIENNFCSDVFIKTKFNIKNQNIKILKSNNKILRVDKLFSQLNSRGKIIFYSLNSSAVEQKTENLCVDSSNLSLDKNDKCFS